MPRPSAPRTAPVFLHGGFAGVVNEPNDLFFRALAATLPPSATVLLVGFAKDPARRASALAADRAQFERNRGARAFRYIEASETEFIAQVKAADLVFLHGGNTEMLLAALRRQPGFVAAVDGKTVAGESAGAYALATHFYSKTIGACGVGLGLVPAAVICHYSGVNAERLPREPHLEQCLLPDFHFRVFPPSVHSGPGEPSLSNP